MNLFKAKIPEIVRAHQKDEEYVQTIAEILSEIVKDFGGHKFWILNYQRIRPFAQVFYYSLTTLSGLQTLGEEYLSLVQLSTFSHHQRVPSFIRRFISVLVHIFGRSFFAYFCKYLQSRSNNRLDFAFLSSSSSISSLQLALFYIFGNYYQLSKRFAGIYYTSLRTQTHYRSFYWIGLLLLAKTLFTLPVQLIVSIGKNNRLQKQPIGEVVAVVDGKSRCPICLQSDKDKACTPCGHLFCWDCIIGMANEARPS